MHSLVFAGIQIAPLVLGAIAQGCQGKRREWIWLVAQLGFLVVNLWLRLWGWALGAVVYLVIGAWNLMRLYQRPMDQ